MSIFVRHHGVDNGRDSRQIVGREEEGSHSDGLMRWKGKVDRIILKSIDVGELVVK